MQKPTTLHRPSNPPKIIQHSPTGAGDPRSILIHPEELVCDGFNGEFSENSNNDSEFDNAISTPQPYWTSKFNATDCWLVCEFETKFKLHLLLLKFASNYTSPSSVEIKVFEDFQSFQKNNILDSFKFEITSNSEDENKKNNINYLEEYKINSENGLIPGKCFKILFSNNSGFFNFSTVSLFPSLWISLNHCLFYGVDGGERLVGEGEFFEDGWSDSEQAIGFFF